MDKEHVLYINISYIQIIKYYSATTENEILSSASTQMDLEGIMFNEIIRGRQMFYVITYVEFKCITNTLCSVWNIKNKTGNEYK